MVPVGRPRGCIGLLRERRHSGLQFLPGRSRCHTYRQHLREQPALCGGRLRALHGHLRLRGESVAQAGRRLRGARRDFLHVVQLRAHQLDGRLQLAHAARDELCPVQLPARSHPVPHDALERGRGLVLVGHRQRVIVRQAQADVPPLRVHQIQAHARALQIAVTEQAAVQNHVVRVRDGERHRAALLDIQRHYRVQQRRQQLHGQLRATDGQVLAHAVFAALKRQQRWGLRGLSQRRCQPVRRGAHCSRGHGILSVRPGVMAAFASRIGGVCALPMARHFFVVP